MQAEPDDWTRVDAQHAQGVQLGGGNVMVNHFLAAVPVARWPVQVGRCPLRADAFQERPDLSAVVAVALSGEVTMTRVLAGDGGTGKTQFAAAAFERARHDGVDLAVWVTASSRTGVLAAYAQAFGATHVGADTGEVERDAVAFLAWLGVTNRSWIVVLDDVADPADLTGLWPTGPTGRVLVTTRRRDAAMAARGPVVDVGVFTRRESVDFLTAKLARAVLPVSALADADQLAADLGCLPLALAQAASVIVNDAVTCAQYRTMLADQTRRLADLFPADPRESGDEYERALAGTWSLAAERADMLAPAGLAHPLLALAAVFDPNGVPETVLTNAAACIWLASRSDSAAVTAPTARRALRNLHRLSLVSHDPTDPARSVRMHALVQRSCLEDLPAPVLTDLVCAAADALMETWSAAEPDAGLRGALQANTAVLRVRYGSELWPLGLHPVFLRAGMSLGDSGLAGDAVVYFDQLLADAGRSLSPDHPDMLMVRYERTYWRGEAGDFAGAAAAQEQLLADRLRVLGPDHPDTLGTRANVAFWRGHAGDPATALADTELVLADQLRTLGPDHLDVLRTRHNLAHWQGQAGDPVAAATATENLLADALRTLGPDHLDTLDTRRNLAYWRGRSGDAAGAATALEEVLEAYVRILGPEHPDTLHTRDDLADWRGRAGNPATAADDYELLLADRLRVLGPDHPHTLNTRLNLAEWKGHTGNLTAAVAAYRELLADHIRILGTDHPQVLSTRSNLAAWRGEAEGAETATTLLTPLLADALRVLPLNHPTILVIRHNHAYWQGRAGDAAGATAALREVVADCLRILGSDNPDTLVTRHNLAYWQARAGDPEGATREFTRLLADQVRVSGPNHPDVLETRHELAGLLQQTGDWSGACVAFAELDADQHRVLGPNHPQTLSTRGHLAELRGLTGDSTGAVGAYHQLLTDAERVLGAGHPDVRRIQSELDRWRNTRRLNDDGSS